MNLNLRNIIIFLSIVLSSLVSSSAWSYSISIPIKIDFPIGGGTEIGGIENSKLDPYIWFYIYSPIYTKIEQCAVTDPNGSGAQIIGSIDITETSVSLNLTGVALDPIALQQAEVDIFDHLSQESLPGAFLVLDSPYTSANDAELRNIGIVVPPFYVDQGHTLISFGKSSYLAFALAESFPWIRQISRQ